MATCLEVVNQVEGQLEAADCWFLLEEPSRTAVLVKQQKRMKRMRRSLGCWGHG